MTSQHTTSRLVHIIRSLGPPTVVTLAILAHGCRTAPLQLSVVDPVQFVSRDRDVSGLKLNVPYGRNRNVNGVDVGIASVVNDRLAGLQTEALFCYAEDTAGVQIGVVGCLAGSAVGLQVGSVVFVENTMTGVQMSWLALSPLALLVASNMYGAQLNGSVYIAANGTDNANGAQVAVATVGSWNYAKDTKGSQVAMGILAAMNTTTKTFCGAQLSCSFLGYNRAGDARGLQLGPVNVATHIVGAQIGVVNYCERLKGVQLGLVNICSRHTYPFIPVLSVRF